MIIIHTFDRRYIHAVKVSFCSQYSLVSTQYPFILQRTFHSSYNGTGIIQYIESLYRNRKKVMRSAIIKHKILEKNSKSHLGKKVV